MQAAAMKDRSRQMQLRGHTPHASRAAVRTEVTSGPADSPVEGRLSTSLHLPVLPSGQEQQSTSPLPLPSSPVQREGQLPASQGSVGGREPPVRVPGQCGWEAASRQSSRGSPSATSLGQALPETALPGFLNAAQNARCAAWLH